MVTNYDSCDCDDWVTKAFLECILMIVLEKIE